VLNRLSTGQADPARAAELARMARNAIVQAVRDILKRDVGEVSPMLAEIGTVLVVGNTAMLALLSGQGAADLLAPENWQLPIEFQPRDAADFQAQWFMPNARILLPGAIAGFVGSDLLADLVALDFVAGPAGSLLLDVGTNTEIALWDGTTLYVTSVPGGPAFEGGGIRFGMPAEPGAICRVRLSGDGFADGRLKPSGRFAVASGGAGLRLDPDNPRTALGGTDIDAFQRAKAATAAAMAVLLGAAGMGWNDLQRLCLCGAFGRTLDIGHAQATGLLPPIDTARIELYADATLAGCERMLLAENGRELAAGLRTHIRAINLSTIVGYDETYIDHLRLRPAPPVRMGEVDHA
jgi:uncharacterized 2Fe-2S/4Fe-4S cluster protein (DUF4445 family)